MDVVSARVLVVDDEPHILKTLEISLRALGCRVQATTSPTAALGVIEPKRFDLALVDVRMEPVDGLEVLAALHARAPETAVVMMSAHSTTLTETQAIRRGADAFLAKPFDLVELREVVERVLASRPKPSGGLHRVDGGSLAGADDVVRHLDTAAGGTLHIDEVWRMGREAQAALATLLEKDTCAVPVVVTSSRNLRGCELDERLYACLVGNRLQMTSR